MKRRSVIMIIMTFMLLTLVGVGFATWIIIAPTEESKAEGNITVETVQSQNSWQFEAKWVDDEGNELGKDKKPEIVFGLPSDMEIEAGKKVWLTNDHIGTENLTVYLYVKASVTDVQVDANDYAKIELKSVVTTAASDGQEATTDEKVLSTYLGDDASVSVTVKEDETNTPVKELSSQQLKDGVTLKITFGWKYNDGETDGIVENPYTHFNKLDYYEHQEAANTYLSKLYGMLKNCSFKVVLTAAVKTSE